MEVRRTLFPMTRHYLRLTYSTNQEKLRGCLLSLQGTSGKGSMCTKQGQLGFQGTEYWAFLMRREGDGEQLKPELEICEVWTFQLLHKHGQKGKTEFTSSWYRVFQCLEIIWPFGITFSGTFWITFWNIECILFFFSPKYWMLLKHLQIMCFLSLSFKYLFQLHRNQTDFCRLTLIQARPMSPIISSSFFINYLQFSLHIIIPSVNYHSGHSPLMVSVVYVGVFSHQPGSQEVSIHMHLIWHLYWWYCFSTWGCSEVWGTFRIQSSNLVMDASWRSEAW